MTAGTAVIRLRWTKAPILPSLCETLADPATMGYTTCFVGRMTFADKKKLTERQWLWLRAFAASCHPERDMDALTDDMDPFRVAVGLPVGPAGVFFVNSAPLEQLIKE